MPEEDGTATVDGTDLGAPTVPEWLQGAELQELMADEGAAKILSFYQSPQEAAKAIVEKERLVASGFRLPKKLKPEHVEQLRPHIDSILGVPEKPEEYDMIRPEKVPEDIDLSEELKMAVRAYGKERHWAKGDVQGLYELALYSMARAKEQDESSRAERYEAKRKETTALMQKYWGPQEFLRLNGDPANNSIGLIHQFVKSRSMDDTEYQDLIDQLGDTGLSHHPLLFKVLGDAAKFYEIMEGHGSVTQSEYAATAGAKKLSAEAQNAQRWPNTPRSMGGGAPG